MNCSSIVLIIDPDTTASGDLAEWLAGRAERPEVISVTSVVAAERFLRMERVGWLFIRVSEWNDYQQVAHFLSHLPERVIFLSARSDECIWHGLGMANVHLLRRTTPLRLSSLWERLSVPGYRSPPLEFFFLMIGGRYMAIRYKDLRQVHYWGGRLLVFTRLGTYEVAEPMSKFERRLPMVLVKKFNNWWVHEGYEEE